MCVCVCVGEKRVGSGIYRMEIDYIYSCSILPGLIRTCMSSSNLVTYSNTILTVSWGDGPYLQGNSSYPLVNIT